MIDNLFNANRRTAWFAANLLVACYCVPQAIADVSIVNYGAESASDTVQTVAIQQAIDSVARDGGGRVVVPEGVFRTGALFLGEGVTLHLAKGAILLGSTDLDDYPRRPTRIEGHTEDWRPALVNAESMQRVRITGQGTLDGNGRPFWTAFWKRRAENPRCTNLEVERPRLIFIEGADQVEVQGIHLKDSGFWNLHLYRCRNVLVDGITITAPHGAPPKLAGVETPWDEIVVDRAPSSDGIDIDSCQDVTIRGCTISVGDDCIALKGSKGPLAMEDRSSPPVENVVVTDCDFQSGHGMLTCGSEATVIRNVRVSRSRVGIGVPVVRFKLRPDTPQRYENFVFEDLTLEQAGVLFDVKPWTQFFDLQGHEPPASLVRNIVLRNMRGTIAAVGDFAGNQGDSIQNIVVENVSLTAARERFRLGDVKNVMIRNSTVNGKALQSYFEPMSPAE